MYGFWLHLGDVLFVVCVVMWVCLSLDWLKVIETAAAVQARGVCDFSPPLGDVEAGRNPSDTGLPVVGSLQLEFGDTEITSSVAITVDSTSIIYVGYTNGSGYFVGAVRI